MQTEPRKLQRAQFNTGSALIMTVVLTVLLAVVGIMFVMSARVDNIATSYISENRELYAAVDKVIEDICQQLVDDVPCDLCQEYYDYPGDDDPWLASLEPYPYLNDPCNPYWRRITNLYESFAGAEDVKAEIVLDSEIIKLDDPNNEYSVLPGQPADADGDGVSDSKWVRLDDIMTSKGRPIFAAVRIIDNGGMLNVNTGYKFDPNGEPDEIDGSSLMQINLLALSERGSTSNPLGKLDAARFGSEPNVLDNYVKEVVWCYNEPNGFYTPFDISDELKLRYRYILNHNLITTRIEELWEKAYDWYPFVPRDSNSQLYDEPNQWFYYANNSSSDIEDYDYRHISTTYNMDRIIQPNGDKMVNINDADANSLYTALKDAIGDADEAAQIAVNLIDFRDDDSDVKSFDPNLPSGEIFYGFERPCVYISELAHNLKSPDVFPYPGTLVYASYAIELYKPYELDNYPQSDQWRLNITNSDYLTGPIDIGWSGTRHFHVIVFEDPCAPLQPIVNFDPNDRDPCLPYTYDLTVFDKAGNFVFNENSTIELQRRVGDSNWVVVDSVEVPDKSPVSGWLMNNTEGVTRTVQRDITKHKCIRRLWTSNVQATNEPDLGRVNAYTSSNEPNRIIPAWPYHPDGGFTNVGEIGLVFRKSAYYEEGQIRNGIGYSSSMDEEAEVRIDATNPTYQNIFNYLTVFDPSRDGINNDSDGRSPSNPEGWIDEDDDQGSGRTREWKIPGRININTAPWFVLAQLPWIRYSADMPSYDDPNQFKRAQAISDYRDKMGAYSGRPGDEGFRNIGELMNVTEMRDLLNDGDENLNSGSPKGPDFTDEDAKNDFEERDLLFTRLSNLVTVRSDVFTAYILVRIGTDGPQKRVIAILDRSGVYSAGDKVRIVAWQPVADPR